MGGKDRRAREGAHQEFLRKKTTWSCGILHLDGVLRGWGEVLDPFCEDFVIINKSCTRRAGPWMWKATEIMPIPINTYTAQLYMRYGTRGFKCVAVTSNNKGNTAVKVTDTLPEICRLFNNAE